MDLDQDLCLCFHVSLRKVKSFIRVEKPRRASQISQCSGAGTGCGWCRPFLEKLMEQSLDPQSAAQSDGPSNPQSSAAADLSAEDYAQLRAQYVKDGKGKPPKA